MGNQEVFNKLAHALREHVAMDQARMMQKIARGEGLLAKMKSLFRKAPPALPPEPSFSPEELAQLKAALVNIGVAGAVGAAVGYGIPMVARMISGVEKPRRANDDIQGTLDAYFSRIMPTTQEEMTRRMLRASGVFRHAPEDVIQRAIDSRRSGSR